MCRPTSDTIADVNTPAGVNTVKSNTLRAAVDAANAQHFPVIIDLTKIAGQTITLTSTAAHPAPTFLLGSLTTAVGGKAWKFVGAAGKSTVDQRRHHVPVTSPLTDWPARLNSIT